MIKDPKMKNLYTILALTLSLFSETNFSSTVISNSIITNGTQGTRGSAIVGTKTIQTEIFHKIHIDIPATLIIRKASKRDISLKTDNNLLKSIGFDVKKETLFINAKESFNARSGITITIMNPHLTSLIADGAVDINIKGYKENEFDLVVDGTGDFIFASGKFEKLSIKADGSYTIDLTGTEVDEATIVAKGSGDIKIDVENYLNVDLEDTVEVRYGGNPKIKKQVSDIADLIHI